MPQSFNYLATAVCVIGVAVVFYILMIGAAQVLRRISELTFGWSYHVFAFTAGILIGVHTAPLLVELPAGWSEPFLTHLASVVILLGAFPAVRVLNHLLWARGTDKGKPQEAPRVLADTTAILVFILVVLAVLQVLYQVKVPGLLAGSGIVAIILGLAMQDLLGNIFGGLAIQLEKPYKPGDWLQIDGTDARVVEITWRSTRLVTNDDILIDVPNSAIVKGRITNFQQPSRLHALHVFLGLHYSIPPERAQAVLREAAATARGVLRTHEPRIRVHEFADSAIVYDIKFWISDHREATRIKSEVRAHAWYAVRRAKMEIPFPIVTLNKSTVEDPTTPARATAAAVIQNHEIFRHFKPEHIARIVDNSPVNLYAKRERVVKQGDTGGSMFVVLSGTLEVRITKDSERTVVANLKSGDCFGEYSLLSGEPRSATVMALEELELLEITHRTIQPLIHENPEVLNRLSELLAKRLAENEKSTSAVATTTNQEKARARVMKNLRRFFNLGG